MNRQQRRASSREGDTSTVGSDARTAMLRASAVPLVQQIVDQWEAAGADVAELVVFLFDDGTEKFTCESRGRPPLLADLDADPAPWPQRFAAGLRAHPPADGIPVVIISAVGARITTVAVQHLTPGGSA